MLVLDDLMIDGLKIAQDDTLYRFTSDAVLLSHFASRKNGDIIADFCSGSGIVGINYYLLDKTPKSVDLIEIQKPLADLSQKTVEMNNLGGVFTVLNQSVQNLDDEYNEKYTLVLCNPPYKKKNSGEQNLSEHIAVCRHEVKITQEEIVSTAARVLKRGGRLAMCQRVERLTDLIVTMRENFLEPVKLQFICTTEKKPPYLFLIEAVKGVKPQLKVLKEKVNK